MPDGNMSSNLETQPIRPIGPFVGPSQEYLSRATTQARKAELEPKVKDMVDKGNVVAGPLTESLLAEAVTSVPQNERDNPVAVAEAIRRVAKDSNSWKERVQQAMQEARVSNDPNAVDAAKTYPPLVFREFVERQLDNAARDAIGPDVTPKLPGETAYDAWDFIGGSGPNVDDTQPNPRVSRPNPLPLPGQQITDEFLAGAAAGVAGDVIRENLKVIKERRSKDQYDKLPYEALREALSSGKLNGEDLSESEMKALKRSQQNRYGEAKTYGLFDATMTKALREALIATEWEGGKYKVDLLDFADKQEAQAQLVSGYRNNDRLNGIVRDGITGIIELATYDGMMKASPEEKTRNGFTPLEIQNHYNKAQQAFWRPRLDYKEIIDQETPEQRQQSEARRAVAASVATRGAGMADTTYAEEVRAKQIGFPEEDRDLMKTGTKEQLEKWLKDKIGAAEDASKLLAQEIYAQIQFGISLVRDHRDKKLHEELFRTFNDRYLVYEFYSAFNAGGKDDFGKAAKQLAVMSREVFEGKSGVERLNRMWKEAFPVMVAMEDRSKKSTYTVKIDMEYSGLRGSWYRNFPGAASLVDKVIGHKGPGKKEVDLVVPRVQAYLNSEGTTKDEEILQEIATETGKELPDVKFGIRMWRLFGRQALMDAYIPKPAAERDGARSDKAWSGINRWGSEDKKLAMLMSFDLYAAKYHFGGNPYLWEVGDTEYRDLISFMFSKDKLEELGLERNKMNIVPDLSKGDQDKLANLDFATLTNDGSVMSDWIGNGEHAGNTATALQNWMLKPGPETLGPVSATFLHLFTNPWGSLKEGAPGPAPYFTPITADEAGHLGKRKWLRFFQVAKRTLDLRTPAYQENPKMIITNADVFRGYAESLVLSASSSMEDRAMQQWMMDRMGATEFKANVAKASNAGLTVLGELVKATFSLK